MRGFLIFIFSAFCVILMSFIPEYDDNFSMRVLWSSLVIQIISIYHIFSKSEAPYSLKKMFYLFSLFFFGIAPLLQFYKGIAFFGARNLKEFEYFNINILIIIILISYNFLYGYFYNQKITGKTSFAVHKLTHRFSPSFIRTPLLLSLSLFSFFMVFRMNNFSILSMLFRGSEFSQELIENQSTTSWLLISYFFRPISMMCLLYYLSSNSKNIIVVFLLSISALVTCSPLGMARFAVAAIYIPLFLIVIPFFRRKNVFSLSIVLGLLAIFPFLNNFRNFTLDNEVKMGFDFEMFVSGHFDSYQNFALVVQNNLITWGNQLLGVFFFWTPRSAWYSKPIGSGAFLADQFGFFFSNVSCNYFAEGYINFGFLGIILFTIAIAFLTSKMDKIYWKILGNVKTGLFQLIYMISIGMLFFILRGDLMSSFAYTIGFMLSIWIVFKATGVKFAKRTKLFKE
jgi:hypothetical protein